MKESIIINSSSTIGIILFIYLFLMLFILLT